VTIVKTLFICLILFALAHLDATPVAAQSSADTFPTTILGFLETGTHLGVQHSDYRRDGGGRDEHFVLQILDNDGWKIANDSRRLPLEELRKKYPVVESLASKTLEDFQDSSATRMDRLPKGKRYSDPDISIARDRLTVTLLCTVVHVGDDYVLVSYGDAGKKRRVLPKHMIKYIGWDDGLPSLSISSKVVDADETEPSVATEATR
jgi:hypothetical protein